ncbi:two-component system LytT family sensor kinase [Pedobacter sp. UYP30]|uniref:sensor histidine kinase n=1 Tax=Pedobacter sp. UYP30 TaxID=1756400 RepID=UPI00339B9299
MPASSFNSSFIFTIWDKILRRSNNKIGCLVISNYFYCMKRMPVFLIHLICWTAFLAYSYGSYVADFKGFRSIAFSVSMTTVQIIQFYICFLWVYPNYLKQHKIPQLIGGMIVALLAFICLRYGIEEVFYPKFFGIRNYNPGTPLLYYFKDNVYWGTSYIVVAMAVYGVQHSFRTEITNKSLKNDVVKAELAFLKSQINPHFLYNTLNYVYSLAIPVSDKLADAVLKLSDLMRYTLSESATGFVQLVKEVDYVNNYIALFKMRFEPNFYIDFNINGVSEDQEIASLMLIPFVENAFKHGVVNEKDSPVRIKLRASTKMVVFEVSNKINRGQKDTSSGVGLLNIQRRLNLIYPDKHNLLVSNNENTYKTTLTIKW